MGKNFLLLSLEDSKAKTLANVVNNKSCIKILDYLAENEATETQIAKKLNLPISTVHYNLSQLMDSKLIKWDKYHYSEKGKEVKHYSLANKYIIIAPKGEDENSIKDKLKNILSTFAITLVGATSVFYLTKNNLVNNFSLMNQEMDTMSIQSNEIAFKTIQTTQPIIEAIPEQTSIFTQIISQLTPTHWFIIGAIFSLSAYFLVLWVKKKIIKQKSLK